MFPYEERENQTLRRGIVSSEGEEKDHESENQDTDQRKDARVIARTLVENLKQSKAE